MDIDLNVLLQSSQIILRKNDMIANNLANINTAGFKRDDGFYNELENDFILDEDIPFNQYTDHIQGDLKSTEIPTDIAISGKGFFTLESDDGNLYTRNGHFIITKDGILEDSFGNRLLGTSGTIEVTGQNGTIGDLRITEKGEVVVDGEIINKLVISNFENMQDLEKIGNNLFKASENSQGETIETENIVQGFLETSNINPVSEMVNLIDMHRRFEATQRVIRTIDELADDAINDVGGV
jgi:flagellar basal-body rod protein FlgG